MSFKRSLTSANKKLRKLHIMNMYNAALETGCLECYFIVLMWMYEFICSFFYFDTKDEVSTYNVMKSGKFNLTGLDIAFMKVFVNIRNEIAHLQAPVIYVRFKLY